MLVRTDAAQLSVPLRSIRSRGQVSPERIDAFAVTDATRTSSANGRKYIAG